MGISEKHAEGGAGSLLKMGKETMSEGDFKSLAGVIPDMDGLLGAVPGMGKKCSRRIGKFFNRNASGCKSVQKARA